MTPEQFKQIRKELGWTQQRLADELGMSRRQIGNYEQGTSPIPKVVSLAIAWLTMREVGTK